MSERLIPPSNSLLKYDNPVLIPNGREQRKAVTSQTCSATQPQSAGSTRPPPLSPPSPPTPTRSHQKGGLNREAQDILNSILPPKEWEDNGHLWKQQVSSTPATRLDVLALQEQLGTRLKQRQAREAGICPVRRELYVQCFDELIRQVTISCSERGLLLARVRDELNLTLVSYQTLYESSLAFGIRKALQGEEGKMDLEVRLSQAEHGKANLQRQLAELQAEIQRKLASHQEERTALEQQHAEEVDFLKRSNQQLKTLLEGVLAPRK